MNSYTDKIKYLSPPDISGKMEDLNFPSRIIKVDPENPIYSRADKIFSEKHYLYPSLPVCLGPLDLEIPEEEVFVLRICIKRPGSQWSLPQELKWTKPFIESVVSYQAAFFPEDRFYYMTIRSGENRSTADDTFHVDGFQGVLVPRHIPQQIYIWMDNNPTLFSMQPYFVEDLDPAKHNIHNLFDKKTKVENCYQGLDKGIYLMDPYHVHAKPKGLIGKRTLVRLSCIPIEIRDDVNTKNPNLLFGQYNKPDPRNFLWDAPEMQTYLKYGVKPL